MDKPLVSVIISSYNHEDFIIKTIDSIINQTYGFENIELIVIDDKSTDNTGIILKDLSEKYQFTFIQNTINKGVCANFNTLIELAKGKYIASCSSDDYWDINKVKKQFELMESLDDDYAICHTDAKIIDENENILFIHTEGKHYSENVLPIVLMSTGIVATSSFFRTDCLKNIGKLDEEMPFEDRDLWIRLGIKYKFAYLPESLVFRRVHKANFGKNPDKTAAYKSYIMLLNKYYIYYEKYHLINDYHYFIFNHISTWNSRFAMKHFIKSGLKVFQIKTIFSLVKVLTPWFFFKYGLEHKLKLIFNRW